MTSILKSKAEFFPAHLDPMPGCYYINRSGKLARVKALLFKDESLSRVAVEYLDGQRLIVDQDEWHFLNLSRYTDWLADRRARRER